MRVASVDPSSLCCFTFWRRDGRRTRPCYSNSVHPLVSAIIDYVFCCSSHTPSETATSAHAVTLTVHCLHQRRGENRTSTHELHAPSHALRAPAWLPELEFHVERSPWRSPKGAKRKRLLAPRSRQPHPLALSVSLAPAPSHLWDLGGWENQISSARRQPS